MKEFVKENKKVIYSCLFLIVSSTIAYIFFQYIFVFIAPFFIGWVFSLLYEPLVHFLNKKFHISRGIGAIIAIALLLTFCSSVVASGILRIISEAKLFYQQLPGYIQDISIALTNIGDKIEGILSSLPEELSFDLNFTSINYFDLFTAFLSSRSGNTSINFVLGIPNALFFLLIALLSSYFFSKDKKNISVLVQKHMPPQIQRGIQLFKQNLGDAFWGYVKSQLILMIFTFFITLIGLFFLQSPYAFLLSIVISIIDALPFFGSGFILWPGALIHVITGSPFMAIGYIIIWLIITLERQVMQPKILSTQIGLNPLLTLFSMYIGLKLFGVFGMILGPILAVLIKAAHGIYLKTGWKTEE